MRIQQLVIKRRKNRRKDRKAPAFNGAPHRKGVIYKIAVMSPRNLTPQGGLLRRFVFYLMIKGYLRKYLG